MKEFDMLIDIIERLMAPDGCPWDREQTMKSMRGSLIEESSEVVEAINLEDNDKIEEELGDLFFNVVFLSKLGEKEHRVRLIDVLLRITAKLIHRHPHVFGDAIVETSEGVLKQWDEIKKTEKKGIHESQLDGIPHELPVLARAQKMLKRIKKTNFSLSEVKPANGEIVLGQKLLSLVNEAQENGLEADQALRSYLTELEKTFKQWERNK